MGRTRTTSILAIVPIVLIDLTLGLVAPATGRAADPWGPDSIRSQSLLRLPAGGVVRVTLVDVEEPVIGRYRGTVAGSIELESLSSASMKQIRTVPTDRARRVEVSRKHRTHTWSGLLVGLLAGGAATFAVAQASSGGDNPAGLVGFVFVPVGMAWGALVGGGMVSHDWETVWESPSRPSP